MRGTIWFGLTTAILTSAVACGGDGGGSGGTGAGATSTTGTGGEGASSTTGTGGSGGEGGSGPTLVNLCDPMALEDHTADAAVEITFGDAVGFKYSPACIKVKSGTMVTWTGSTGSHPLQPGEVIDGIPTPSMTGPIKYTSDANISTTFTIAPAGSYPYYCGDHFGAGMRGLIVAE